MENKVITINISADSSDEPQNENAGVMWEHNATTLVFNIDENYIGDFKYYIEYRSLLGTKIRTEYLVPEENQITYPIPVSMSSLKSVECFFNIVKINEDGETTLVIKPKRFCLDFDYSPDTDNSLARENDFSINSLLEAIRLGTFKGDKGDTGEKGEKGDAGEVTIAYANKNYSTALKGELTGKIVATDDALVFDNSLDIQAEDYGDATKVKVCGKNLFDITKSRGFFSSYGGIVSTIKNDKISVVCTVASRTGYLELGFFPAGTYYISAHSDNPLQLYVGDSFETTTSVNLQLPATYTIDKPQVLVIGQVFYVNKTTSISKVQVECGETQSDYEAANIETYTLDSEGKITVTPASSKITVFADGVDTNITCKYTRDINKVIDKMEQAITQLGSNL